MLRLMISDLREKSLWCHGDCSMKSLMKTCLTDGTCAMLFYRMMQAARRWKLEPLAMLFNKMNGILCQCIIGRGAEFGPGFVLIHSTGVVINGNVKGGSRVFIEHQVTIGAEKNQTPQLGDNIFIGAGAKIIGPVRVGSHAKIGANAVVVKDVPAYATVGGIPAKIIKYNSDSDTNCNVKQTNPHADIVPEEHGWWSAAADPFDSSDLKASDESAHSSIASLGT